MKIVILDHEPYAERKDRHYKISDFKKLGVSIEYWSLVDVLPYLTNVAYNYRRKESFVHYIVSFEQYSQMVSGLDKRTIVIVEFYYRYETFKFFSLLRKQKLTCVRIDYYYNPTNCLNLYKNKFDVRIKRFLQRGAKHVIKNVVAEILKRVYRLDAPAAVFLTGSKTPNNGNYISIDYFDVEEFKYCLESHTLSLPRDYIVFLDTMIVNHPDWQRVGVRKTISEEEYYPKMRAFFDRLESLFSCSVIVAAHPKSNYTNEFGDRLVILNKTGELVKRSKFVITHGSLSIDFALLYKKPIYLLKFKVMQQKESVLYNTYKRMLALNRYTGAEILDVEDLADIPIVTPDVARYNSFLNDYYRMRDEDSSNIRIFLDAFTQLVRYV